MSEKKELRFPLVPEYQFTRLFGNGEYFPSLEETPELLFTNAEGKIRAGCYFGQRVVVFDLGIVPDEIADQGPEAVRVYATQKMEDLIARERQRRTEREERIQNLRREYVVEHEGIVLRGFVTKDVYEGPRADFMKLTMTEPFQISTRLYVRPQCFADGMMDTRSFDEDGNLLEQEIERQQQTLVQMYKQWIEQQKKLPPHPTLAALLSSKKS